MRTTSAGESQKSVEPLADITESTYYLESFEIDLRSNGDEKPYANHVAGNEALSFIKDDGKPTSAAATCNSNRLSVDRGRIKDRAAMKLREIVALQRDGAIPIPMKVKPRHRLHRQCTCRTLTAFSAERRNEPDRHPRQPVSLMSAMAAVVAGQSIAKGGSYTRRILSGHEHHESAAAVANVVVGRAESCLLRGTKRISHVLVVQEETNRAETLEDRRHLDRPSVIGVYLPWRSNERTTCEQVAPASRRLQMWR
ncbi:hypothetical protein WN55_00217 [Dufourea novaeangliae]|uniref:Uncharacterized protein n=1 Tax=Dufourea novaeangliae TaxID=178035 RepID=A0A154PCC8_DUFNO|nr:hypothetical protein WN55_00217 [Dufourea novaeangliae]